ncbi:MAG: hypothetical protein II401_10415 [Bacteroidales bacterium]|nr:hypothetical protein [Bacteroidales bacterium]
MYEIEEFYKRAEQEAKEERKRILIECGIFNKKYSSQKSEDYPFYDDQAKRYFRKIAVEVSDEDYKNVLDYYNSHRKQTTNTAEKTLSVMAVVVLVLSVIGFAAGIVAVVSDAALMAYAVAGVVTLVNGLAVFALFRVIANISKKLG